MKFSQAYGASHSRSGQPLRRCGRILGMLALAPLCHAGDALTEQFPRVEPEPVQEVFQLREAIEESMLLLTLQHGFRLMQPKTQRELSGPFGGDYWRSVRGLRGWRDGDNAMTNYVAHPIQGATAGYIYIQNSPSARHLYFSSDRRYWTSRLKAMGWSALYSTQFELGPYSEASIGNVGMNDRTMGYVDLVITPSGGFAWMVAEDAVDRLIVRRLERRANRGVVRVLRTVLGPNRSFANMLRFKKPWLREARD